MRNRGHHGCDGRVLLKKSPRAIPTINNLKRNKTRAIIAWQERTRVSITPLNSHFLYSLEGNKSTIMTKSNKNSSSSNNKKKKRSCVNKGNNFWYAHCKRFRDDDKNRYESAAHYTRHESSEGLNEKDTRVFQMKLNAYDKKVLKPDNRHRRRKWSVVEEGLMRVVRHSPKDSFLTASGRPDFSKLRKAAKQVVEEKIVNHPELAGFKTRKEWFVDAVESNPNLFQLSQSVACQEAEVGGSEDGAAEQDKDEPVQIVDRIKVPKHVMDEFGTIVIVDWRGKGVPGIISDPREGSPEAKKIWVEMYDKVRLVAVLVDSLYYKSDFLIPNPRHMKSARQQRRELLEESQA